MRKTCFKITTLIIKVSESTDYHVKYVGDLLKTFKEEIMELTENVIEWITGDDRVTVTLSQRKFITKVEKLAESHPNDVKITARNSDGSIVAHLPLKAIKFSIIERNITDEQREELANRLKKSRESSQL